MLAATLRSLAAKRGDGVEITLQLDFGQLPESFVADAVLAEDDGGKSEGAEPGFSALRFFLSRSCAAKSMS